jgi:hypothetical protein
VATYQTSVVISGIDKLSGVLNKIAGSASGFRQKIAALGQATIATPGSAIGKMAHGSHALLAPIERLGHGMWEQVKEIEKAKQQLQKSFLITDLLDAGSKEVEEYNQLIQKAEDLTKNSALYRLQDNIEAMQKIRSMNVSTGDILSSMDGITALASVQHEPLDAVAESIVSITRAMYGLAESPEQFRRQLDMTSNTAAIMSKRLGISVASLHQITKNAAPAFRMLAHPELAALDKQIEHATSPVDKEELRKKKDAVLNESWLRLNSFAAALKTSGFQDEEIGNALKAIGTRATAPTPKAIDELRRNGINPYEYISFRPDLLSGQSIAGDLSGRFGEDFKKHAPAIQKAIDSAGNDYWKIQDAIVGIVKGTGHFDKGGDKAFTMDTIKKTMRGSMESADLVKLMKLGHEKQLTPAAMQALASLYHISKFVDMTPQAYGQERGVLDKEMARQQNRMEMLKAIAQGGLPGALQALTASFSAFSNEIFKTVRGDVVDGILDLRNALYSISDFAKAHPSLFKSLALGIAAFAALGPAYFVLSSTFAALSALLSLPLWGFIAAAVGVYKWLSNVAGLGDAAASALKWVGWGLEAFGDGLTKLFNGDVTGAMDRFRSSWGGLVMAFNQFAKLDFAGAWGKLNGVQKAMVSVGSAVVALRYAFPLLRFLLGKGAIGGVMAWRGLARAIGAVAVPMLALARIRGIGALAGLSMGIAGAGGLMAFVRSITLAGAAAGVLRLGLAALGFGLRVLLGPISMLITGITALVTHWGEFTGLLMAGLGNAATAVVELGKAIVAAFRGDWSGVFNHLLDSAIATFSAIGDIATAAVKAIFVGLVDMFGGDGVAAWNHLVNIVSAVLNTVKDSVSGAVDFIQGVWSSLDLAAPFRAAMPAAEAAIAKVRELLGLQGSSGALDPNGYNKGGFFKDDGYEYLPDGSRKKKLSSFSEQGVRTNSALAPTTNVTIDPNSAVNVSGSADVNVTVKVDAPKGLNATGTATAKTVPLKRGTNFA